ncbi:TPA: hypothetical protein ACH3X2_002193 [Trebouxia sp. C0005]
MSDLVQTNLHRLINKSQKRRSAPHENEPCPVLKRPSLLTRLADSGDQSQPVTKCTQPVHQHSSLAGTTARRGNGQPSAALGRCPVCGDHMAADLLPGRVEQELNVLADEDASCTASMSSAQPATSTQSHRPGALQPLQSSARRPNAMWKAESSHQPQHSKVLSKIGIVHARTCTRGLYSRSKAFSTGHIHNPEVLACLWQRKGLQMSLRSQKGALRLHHVVCLSQSSASASM